MANPGNPTLSSPIGGILITDNTPTLNFTIPSDTDNDKLVFMVEVDTHDPIDTMSSDYLQMESRKGVGSWQYDPGTGYVDIPPSGVGPTAYNKSATVTIPGLDRLRNAIWYWKISVSDQLKCGVYNGSNSIFGQVLYCSGV
jgi:hypothetical protein